MKNLERGSSIGLDNNSGVAVIGVSPRYRVHLVRGLVDGQVWHKPFNDVPEANLFPENGYIVVKLDATSPNEKWSIPIIMPEGIGGPVYLPCDGSIAPTFTLEGGGFTYVGDISYTYQDKRLSFALSSNEKAARTFLEAAYPAYAKTMRTASLVPMKVKTTACNPTTITVPIYLPGR